MEDMMNTPMSKVREWWNEKGIEVLVLSSKNNKPLMAFDCSWVWDEFKVDEFRDDECRNLNNKIPNYIVKNTDWEQAYKECEYKDIDDRYRTIECIEELSNEWREEWIKELWKLIELEMVEIK